jgi:hypothetical protein
MAVIGLALLEAKGELVMVPRCNLDAFEPATNRPWLSNTAAIQSQWLSAGLYPKLKDGGF